MDNKNAIFVRISSPDKLIWEGDALSLSSVNSQGPFDILPYHANFISIIENQPLKIRTPVKTEEFVFPNCIIYAHENKVIVFTNL